MVDMIWMCGRVPIIFIVVSIISNWSNYTEFLLNEMGNQRECHVFNLYKYVLILWNNNKMLLP